MAAASVGLDLGHAGVYASSPQVGARPLGELDVSRLEAVELRLGELLEVEELVVCTFDRTDQLVELELDSGTIPVLSVLDEEHHEERDDGRRRVDDELPRRPEVEDRSRDEPGEDECDGSDERDWVARRACGVLCEASKYELRYIRRS